MADASITASPPKRSSHEMIELVFIGEVGGACAPPCFTLLAASIGLPAYFFAIASRICFAASVKALLGSSACWETSCIALPHDVHTADISGMAGIGRPCSPALAKA